MAYIYQADIYCDSCGEAIKDDLDANGSSPEFPDEYPKHCGDDEESDCPQFCGSHNLCLSGLTLPSGFKVGFPFGNSLTDDGERYLAELYGSADTELKEVYREYWGEQLRVENNTEDDDDSELLVFVYGTLRNGQRLHHYMTGEFVSEGTTKGQLLSFGPYPCFVTGNQDIVGEVYRVNQDTLAMLDRVEHVASGLYVRELRTITTPIGDVQAYVYRYNGDKSNLFLIGNDWTQLVTSITGPQKQLL